MNPAEPQQPDLSPRRRLILLGASNLVRGLPAVIATAQSAWGRPLDVLAAIGHGRSYGTQSRVLGRTLPAIRACGLWEDLARRAPAPTASLITDIGNDILYRAPVSLILRWVEQCLGRLADVSQHVVVTELPLESLQTLDRFRFLLLRTLLFPTSRLPLSQAIREARQLNQGVVELAHRYDAHLVRPRKQWFGLDPIHITYRRQADAWRQVFSCWCQTQELPLTKTAPWHRWRLRCLRPQWRRLFGIEQRRQQPAARLRDGSVVSLY